MDGYLSVNLYTFEDLRPLGSCIMGIVEALFQLSPKYRPVKFRADLVGKRRNRFFKASTQNLNRLKEELVAGAIRELQINDNEGPEGVRPRLAYDTNLYGLAFWLGLTKPLEKATPALPSSPNECQFLIRADALADGRTFSDLITLSKRAFSSLSSSWGDIYYCSSHRVCFDHLIGISCVQFDQYGIKYYLQVHPHSFESPTMVIIDRTAFIDTTCDTLARDAYFGVFLGPVHVRLLGGMERLRKDVPYEVIEALPGGGAFLMASSDPFKFEAPEVQARIERLREVLAPISMAQVEGEREARAIAERLRSSMAGAETPST